MVRKACQSRYVKILWLGTCVFYSHSGLLLTCQQLAPHLERLFLLWFPFSYEYFMGHPTPPQSFQEKRVHSFILQWPVRQQPSASIHCRQPVQREVPALAQRSKTRSVQTHQWGVGCLKKRHHQPYSKPTVSELELGVHGLTSTFLTHPQSILCKRQSNPRAQRPTEPGAHAQHQTTSVTGKGVFALFLFVFCHK